MSEANETIGEAHEGRPYFWFQGDSVIELYQALSEYDPHVARLEVHTHGNKMYFHVKGPDGDGGDIINKSHICPPDCP